MPSRCFAFHVLYGGVLPLFWLNMMFPESAPKTEELVYWTDIRLWILRYVAEEHVKLATDTPVMERLSFCECRVPAEGFQ